MRLAVASAGACVAMIALAGCARPSVGAPGSALSIGESYTIGMSVTAGHWVQITSPPLDNASKEPLHLVSIGLVDVPAGVSIGSPVVHDVNDTGGFPLSWSQDVDRHAAGSPVVAPTFPLSTVVSPAGGRPQYYVMLPLTPAKPGSYVVKDVMVTYTLGDSAALLTQTLPVELDITAT